jgi:hypothetical protein
LQISLEPAILEYLTRENTMWPILGGLQKSAN